MKSEMMNNVLHVIPRMIVVVYIFTKKYVTESKCKYIIYISTMKKITRI